MEYSTEYLALRYVLRNLQARVDRIEASLNLDHEPVSELEALASGEQEIPTDALEFNIGQNWFAKIGIITLVIGIGFLLALPYPGLPSILPGVIGYGISAAILLLAHRWQTSFHHISGFLLGGGIVLLFFATLRFHFFSAEPAIQDRTLVTFLLICSVAIGFLLSMSRRSVYLVGVSLTLGYGAALFSNQALFLFLGVTALSTVSVAFAIRK